MKKTVTEYNSQNLIYKEVWDDLNRQLLERLPVVRHKVTASRLPALLGFYGKAKFIACMDIIREGQIENDISWIRNIEQGRKFEAIAIDKMMQQTKATIKSCRVFIDPCNERYGASPDGAIPLEVKTPA